ncbi:MAG TPA: helicase-associated domain-containing protein, partial [Microlunatus sp.]
MIPALPLATWLANRSLSDLADLLYRRRDHLAGYRLVDFHRLADVLQDPWVLPGALPPLPLPALQVIEAHAALGQFVTIDALSGLLTESGSPEQHRANVVGVLDLLSADALAWSADGVHWGLATGFEQLIPSPLGLGPSGDVLLAQMNVATMKAILRELGLPRTGDRTRLEATLRGFYLDADAIRAQVAAAPSAIRGALEEETAGRSVTPTGHPRDRRGLDRDVESWGAARAMLFRDLNYQVVMPSQVRLALRGNDFRAPFDPVPGEIPTTSTPVDQVTGEAGAAALAFIATTTMVMDSLARQPIPALKDGGVGVREIRKLAKTVRVTEAQVTLALALARAVGLVSERTSRVGASDLYRTWSRTEPNVRLAQLVSAWWRLVFTPTLTAEGEASNDASIVASVHLRDEPLLRQATIRAVVDCGEGQSVTDLAALAARIAWSHPVLVAGRAAAIPTIVAEAQLLGVLGGTGGSPMAFALSSAEEPDLTAAALATLPATTTTATFGSDLTVLVSGSPTARVTTLLDTCADRESSGSAGLWRFSPTSVRRALDEGSSAAELLSALVDIASGPLPQPLEFLITDIGRRHGVVTVTAGVCVLRSDQDPALLQQICSDRSLKQLDLQLIAPTVALSQQSSETTLTTLRRAGYLPSDASGPAAGIQTSPNLPRNGLPGDELDLDELAKVFGVDIERMLEPSLAGPVEREANERSARQRARAMAET